MKGFIFSFLIFRYASYLIYALIYTIKSLTINIEICFLLKRTIMVIDICIPKSFGYFSHAEKH